MKFKFFLVIASSLILTSCIPSLSTDKGSTDSGEFAKGKVVKGFPNLPLYPKSQVVETIGQKGSYGGSFVANADLAKVVKFYDESLPKLGWESKVKQQSVQNFVFEVKNSQLKGTIIVNTVADGKKTAITIWAEPR